MILKNISYLCQLTIVLSTENIYQWVLWIHDRNHFVPADSDIYGSALISNGNFGKPWTPNLHVHSILPTETIFLDKDNDRCLSTEEISKESLFECLNGHMQSKMDCTLPWYSKKGPQDLLLCSHPTDYLKYVNKAKSMPKDPYSIKNIAKCSPSCIRYEYSAKLFRNRKVSEGGTPFQYYKTIQHLKDVVPEYDSSRPQVTYQIFYPEHEFPTREQVYTYDELNLISDFGGYLGLLLGYSILRFYHIAISMVGNVLMKLNSKRQSSRIRCDKTPAKRIRHQTHIMFKGERAKRASLRYRGRGLGRDGSNADTNRHTPPKGIDQIDPNI